MFLGRYDVIRKIGSGGFGEVLLARSIGAEGFERIVALKRLKGDLARKGGSLQGIINEARIGGILNHPNVVQVLEFIQVGQDYLLVMEYVDGVALQEVLEMERDVDSLLTPGLALDIVIQACEGLHYAHAARSGTGIPLKLIHRDIKPSNIMITRTGTVKIMDFGVARSAANMGQSSTGSIKGTLRYLSPEQAEGSKEIGLGTDLFSLGLVLCEMIVGHSVYEATQEHLMLLRALQAETKDVVDEAERLVPGIGPLLTKTLATDSAERYQTADEMAQALRRLKRKFPVGEGLQDLVEQVLEVREKLSGDDNPLEETSFSLELRRTGLAEFPRGVPADFSRNMRGLITSSSRSEGNAADLESRPPDAVVLNEGGGWEWEWRANAPESHSELDEYFVDGLDFEGSRGSSGAKSVHKSDGSGSELSVGDRAPSSDSREMKARSVGRERGSSARFQEAESDASLNERREAEGRVSLHSRVMALPAIVQWALGVAVAFLLVGLGFALGIGYRANAHAASTEGEKSVVQEGRL